MTMRTHIARLLLLLLGLTGAATTAAAHHSQSQFEPEKTVKVEGTLTRLSWRNPHTLFLVQGKLVNATEAEQEWTVEGPSPQQLTRIGWGGGLQGRGQGHLQRPAAARRKAGAAAAQRHAR